MKVLFLSGVPCSLAHGGAQVVADKLMEYLPGIGVEAEPLRWWDGDQRGDILHHIGRPPMMLVDLAHGKGMKCVMTQFLDQTSNRSKNGLRLRRAALALSQKAGALLRRPHDTEVYRKFDAMVFVNRHEWGVAQYLYGARPDRGHTIGHGLDAEALTALAAPSAPVEVPYLVSAATIVARKNSVRLAECALEAEVPVHFLGKPLSESDPYFRRFMDRVDGKKVVFRGFVSEEEKQRALRDARGFVLLSEYESGCIAVYEAAAAGLPLFLSDLPWARKHYPESPRIEHVDPGSPEVPARLRHFFETHGRESVQTFPVPSWQEVAGEYKAIYERVLA